MPNIIETADAAANSGTAYTLAIGQTAQGTLPVLGDQDWWRVNLVAGQTYTFALVGTGSNFLFDAFLILRNGAGIQLVASDDEGPGRNSSITFTASATGTYYLDAGAYSGAYTGQYGLSAILGNRAHYDAMMGAGNLIRPGLSWSAPGTPANVTWSVSTSNPGQTDAQNNLTPFIAPSPAQVAAVQASLGQFSEAANITFTQINPGGTSNNGTIRVSSYFSTTDGAGAYASYPGSTDPAANAGNINLNNNSVSTTSLPQGSYSFFAVLHELGHAVGLAHPGDYNAAPGVNITYNTHAQFTEDSHQYSVMSYFDESNTTDSYGSYPDTLMMFDILALQQLYGVNNTTRAGNSTYGFNANTGNTYNFAINTTPAFCIWDGGGIDTIDASGYAQSQLIDLRDGTFSDIGGIAGNVSIAVGAVIERAYGGSGADFLFGNAAANTLSGNGGADLMQGFAGNDTYGVHNTTDIVDESVAGSSGVDMVNATVTVSLLDAVHFKGNIENVTLYGAGNISATGNNLANLLIGNSGNNTLNGNGGADIMRGLSGNDLYGVHDITDVVDESIAGSAGIDSVNSVVNMSLITVAGAALGLGAVENVTLYGAGNIFAYGNTLANVLVGNAGSNVLAGGLGNDTLTGAGGNDFFLFNTALGGANVDTITDMNEIGNDTIRLENAIFTTLAAGALAAGAFHIGAAAAAADDRVVYNSVTGALIYDSNGNAAGGAVGFAQLDTGLALTAADFFVV